MIMVQICHTENRNKIVDEICRIIEENEVDNKEQTKSDDKQPTVETKIIIGYCSRCKKPIEQREDYVVENGIHGEQKIYCRK